MNYFAPPLPSRTPRLLRPIVQLDINKQRPEPSISAEAWSWNFSPGNRRHDGSRQRGRNFDTCSDRVGDVAPLGSSATASRIEEQFESGVVGDIQALDEAVDAAHEVATPAGTRLEEDSSRPERQRLRRSTSHVILGDATPLVEPSRFAIAM